MNTYNPDFCCGEDCYKFDFDDEQKTQPCWGKVRVVDEIRYGDDWNWVHACEGHYDMWDGGSYKNEKSE